MGKSPLMKSNSNRKIVSLAALVLVTSVVALTGCGSSGSNDENLTVGAASSLRTALADYQGPDGAEIPPVRITFAGSDLIASQIRQGVGIDVIAAASTTDPDALFKDGLVEKPVAYAQNEVVIGVPVDSSINSIDDLAETGTKVVVGDAAVPVGGYTQQIIDDLPASTGSAIEDNVKSEEPDVASITAKLVQGAADAGFIYATDVLSAPDDIKAIKIPDGLQPTVIYSAAVVKDSKEPEAAAEYIDGLLTGTGAQDLKNAGFLPAP